MSKLLGLFRLSRHLTRRGLRILCYHGFATGDESTFRPKLFITCETFQRRIELLRAHDYPILSLEEALDRLDHGDMPACATVITIDDGFCGVDKFASKLLDNFSFPITLYVTTYHCQKETPVFRLVVQYMFWKTNEKFLDVSDLDRSLVGKFSLGDTKAKETATWEIIKFGEEQCEEEKRVALARRLGKLLAVDFEEIYRTRRLSLLTGEEIQSLAARGIDVQLHTHRHRLPRNEADVTKEIMDNRAFLKPLVQQPLQHFCYPSGLWSEQFLPWLATLGIKSAVTCEPGLNYPGTSKLSLKRFLDGESVSEIELEAELTGYNELLRRVKFSITNFLMARKGKDDESRTGTDAPLPAV